MRQQRRGAFKAIVIATLFAMTGGLIVLAHAADDVEIGFLIKQPEEPWFQDEWKLTDQAAKEKGFRLVKIGAPNGGGVLTAIDNLSAQHAQGFVICVPDVKLGPAVMAKAKQNNLKLMTVDDHLVGDGGRPTEAVLHMGISAMKIGGQIGDVIVREMKKRGWSLSEVDAIRIACDQLLTTKGCTNGAVATLSKVSSPAANVLTSPQAKADTEAALNVANITLTKNPKSKHWVAFGLNDEAVLGVVRAVEGHGMKPTDIIGVGIGGSQSALNKLAKPEKTGFFGTVLISPKRHGYEISLNMHERIKNNKALDPLVLTSGRLMTRDNEKAVHQEMGL